MELRVLGFRFCPTDKYLIRVLQFAANGDDISLHGKVSEVDLYGEDKEPWKLFSRSDDEWEIHGKNYNGVKEKFIVTKLPPNSSRNAGAGSWEWEGPETEFPLMSGGRVIGYWKIKKYVYHGDAADAAGKDFYWMNEYRLSEHSLHQIGISNTDYVLCRIIRDEYRECLVRNDGAAAV